MQQAIRRASEQIRHREYLNASCMDRLTGELNQTLDHLLATRARTVDSLARTHADWGRQYVAKTGYHPDWLTERRAAAAELVDVECELRRTLDESAQFRRTYRELPVLDSAYSASVVGRIRKLAIARFGNLAIRRPFASTRWLDRRTKYDVSADAAT